MSRRTLLIVFCSTLLSGSLCRAEAPAGEKAATRIVTDMAGRKVEIPANIHKVLCMSPTGTLLIYTLDPSMLLGWNYPPDAGERAYLAEPYRDLPTLGGWFGKDNTGNLEKIMQAHPDVLISMDDAFAIALAERVQGQTNIPVIILDGRLERLPEAYEIAGKLLGNAPHAAELAAECRRTLNEIKQKVAGIPQDKRRRYYYAEGPKGLETESGGSMHVEALNFAGGVDVAAGIPGQTGYGRSPVSMEQVLRWNPEIVISARDHTTAASAFYKTVWTNSAWQLVAAVRNREVYEAPQYPFSWLDRPPSANRIIGIKWLANLFYPEIFRYDMRQETRRFYETFYHVQLSEAQMDELLSTAVKTSAGKTK
ncbi:MAG: ABC transporter substrate-binding protein [Terracidiphilus sp.]|jgi:iron complex transport system substrate-binding protein